MKDRKKIRCIYGRERCEPLLSAFANFKKSQKRVEAGEIVDNQVAVREYEGLRKICKTGNAEFCVNN